jgi:hypothetical protein
VPTLGIDLQSGFEDDEVVISVNGEQRLHREGVNTRRVLGLAGSMRIELDAGAVAIDVNMPRRAVEKHLELDLQADTYVGLSLENDDVRVIVRDERFGYG